MTKGFITAALLGMTVASAALPSAAMADYWDPASQSWHSGSRYDQRYEARQSRAERRHYYRNKSRYAGYRGPRRCYDKGNGGLAIGAVAGGLLGNVIDGGHNRLAGTVLGAGAGALAGRAIDRSDGRPC